MEELEERRRLQVTAVNGTGEIRTYQYRVNNTVFPSRTPPGVEDFVVTWVIQGTFEPQSFGLLRAISHFEPYAFGICNFSLPFVINPLVHAEVSFSRNLVMSSTEPEAITESAKKNPPFFGIGYTIVSGVLYDPDTDTMRYLTANSRIDEADPFRPYHEEVNAVAGELGIVAYRVPNYEECPEIGLNP